MRGGSSWAGHPRSRCENCPPIILSEAYLAFFCKLLRVRAETPTPIYETRLISLAVRDGDCPAVPPCLCAHTHAHVRLGGSLGGPPYPSILQMLDGRRRGRTTFGRASQP